jgi:hypothetical protein
VLVLVGHTASVNAVATGVVDGQTLILSGGDDGTVRLWDPATGACTAVFGGHAGSVLSVAAAELDDRSVIVSAGDDLTVRVWEPPLAAPPRGASHPPVPRSGRQSLVQSIAVVREVDRLGVGADGQYLLLARGTTLEFITLAAAAAGAEGVKVPLGFAPLAVAAAGGFICVGGERGIVVIEMQMREGPFASAFRDRGRTSDAATYRLARL